MSIHITTAVGLSTEGIVVDGRVVWGHSNQAFYKRLLKGWKMTLIHTHYLLVTNSTSRF